MCQGSKIYFFGHEQAGPYDAQNITLHIRQWAPPYLKKNVCEFRGTLSPLFCFGKNGKVGYNKNHEENIGKSYGR